MIMVEQLQRLLDLLGDPQLRHVALWRVAGGAAASDRGLPGWDDFRTAGVGMEPGSGRSPAAAHGVAGAQPGGSVLRLKFTRS